MGEYDDDEEESVFETPTLFDLAVGIDTILKLLLDYEAAGDDDELNEERREVAFSMLDDCAQRAFHEAGLAGLCEFLSGMEESVNELRNLRAPDSQ